MRATRSFFLGLGASRRGLAVVVLLAGAAACHDSGRCRAAVFEDTVAADFTTRPGVEIVTVLDAPAGTPLTLYTCEGEPLVAVVADEHGQAHFAYVPPEFQTLESGDGAHFSLTDGDTLDPGYYVIVDESADPRAATAPFRVMDVYGSPPPEIYDRQALRGIVEGLITFPDGQTNEQGFNYITVRDGVKLSAMVRFPDPALYGDGPYPTVIEYSGYSTSRPDRMEPGTQIASLMGFATVSVNMRGTGCSGGVFDVFSPAQFADGYDVVEVVGRQPWVLNHRVGMVGLSYSGIAQLYVAQTVPPRLAAITPASTIADLWAQQWPGGIYNSGFTQSWLETRDDQAASGGQSWTDDLIEAGDTVCAAHQTLRAQNIDFEIFLQQLEFFPTGARSRSLPELIERIRVPVFLSGAFQDEQTGAQFADMLDRFDNAAIKRFTVYNGRHPDGYAPQLLSRWFEFLEIYVSGRVPRMNPLVRALAPEELSDTYGTPGLELEPDRFEDFYDSDYAGVRAAYEAEPPVRVLFENGGHEDFEPGAPVARFEAAFDSFPPPSAVQRSFYLASGESLGDDVPATREVNAYRHDPEAGQTVFFGDRGYEIMAPIWDIDWTHFAPGDLIAYVTAPLAQDLVAVGPALVELWFASDATDTNVQVTLSEVTADDNEVLVAWGWLRAGHREVDPDRSRGLRIARTFTEQDYEPLVPGEWVELAIPVPSFAHAFRAGSRVRLVVSTPGRNHGLWRFDNPPNDGGRPVHRVAHGPEMPSRLTLSLVDGIDVPVTPPACPSLRGQPCRPYVHAVNTVLD